MKKLNYDYGYPFDEDDLMIIFVNVVQQIVLAILFLKMTGLSIKTYKKILKKNAKSKTNYFLKKLS